MSPHPPSRDVSTLSLFDYNNSETPTDNISTRALYEVNLDDELQYPPLSRPLSRSSVTSGLSMVATKDGVEGRRVPRHGITQYSVNLANSMNAAAHWKKAHPDEQPKDFLNGPPLTLKEKMRLFNEERPSQSNNDSLDSFADTNFSVSGRHQLSVPRLNSELESNTSTLGDDSSYLYDMRSIPAAVSITDSEKDSASSRH
ncbi:AaceriACL030Cp [[Ashbya] aceris (nom. inval.)]|nr:AaceriACL030Cp [[Ashbya] aceris (nom. inval.)]